MTAQFVGICAMLASVLSFQLSTRKKIIKAQIITVILFSLHFLMLGAFTGAAMNATSLVRNFVFLNKDKRFFNGKVWVVIFVLINIITGVVFWQNWVSVLSIAGMVINTISLSLKDAQKVRVVMLMSSPFVLLYSIFTGSVGGVINEVFSEVSAIYALIRYRNKQMFATAENFGGLQ